VSIPVVSKPVLSYFRTFDLAAIAQTRDGRLVSTRNPAGHEQAWWGKATEIGPVLDRARADHGDVGAAAAALRIKVVPHAEALQRTEMLVAKLDARVRTVQEAGDLSVFNKAYRRYRLDPTAAGRAPMSYTVARARLRKALVEAAAGKPGARRDGENFIPFGSLSA
jgi:hypothetical protein